MRPKLGTKICNHGVHSAGGVRADEGLQVPSVSSSIRDESCKNFSKDDWKLQVRVSGGQGSEELWVHERMGRFNIGSGETQQSVVESHEISSYTQKDQNFKEIGTVYASGTAFGGSPQSTGDLWHHFQVHGD